MYFANLAKLTLDNLTASDSALRRKAVSRMCQMGSNDQSVGVGLCSRIVRKNDLIGTLAAKILDCHR